MFVITVDYFMAPIYASVVEDVNIQTLKAAIRTATRGAMTNEECQQIAETLIERSFDWRQDKWLFSLRVVADQGLGGLGKNVAAKVVGDKLDADGSFESANLGCLSFRSEKDVTELYSKYLDVYNRSYAEGSAPGRSIFMSMPWEYVSALEFRPGDLVQSGNKYYAVDRLKMKGNKVVLLCVDSDGVEKELEATDVSSSSIPRAAVQAIREGLIREQLADRNNKTKKEED